MINPQPAVRVDAREAERLARIAAMRKRDHVRLTPYEIQSGLDRVRLAELLIQQLPADHDGRNTWLHNYAGKKHEDDRVALTPAPTEAGGVRLRAVSDNGKRWRVIPEDGDWEMVPCHTPPDAAATIERLQEKVRNLTVLLDQQFGTPCAQIAYAAELASLREKVKADVADAYEDAARAGWNACRKSIYAVCEDVMGENDKHREDTENSPRHHFGRGGMAAAKSIARGFNSMEAEDDDNFRAAIRARVALTTEEG